MKVLTISTILLFIVVLIGGSKLTSFSSHHIQNENNQSQNDIFSLNKFNSRTTISSSYQIENITYIVDVFQGDEDELPNHSFKFFNNSTNYNTKYSLLLTSVVKGIIRQINSLLKEICSVPLFVLHHSWKSFLV